MVTNGYFEAEPLVVIPKDTKFSENQQDLYNTYKDSPQNQYIVVEGNRRLYHSRIIKKAIQRTSYY